MEKIRIVIVDDSPFSIITLRDMLTEKGYEVVGEAKSLEEVKEVVEKTRPDVVTMDVTIPGTDGFECTRAVHAIDPNIKVIMVSSMMDDEIIKKAKKNKACGYVQKPVDIEELSLIINRAMADEELFKELNDLYLPVFKETLVDTFNKLIKTIPSSTNEVKGNLDIEHISNGVCVVVGIIGKYSGSMILDMSMDTANKLTSMLIRRDAKNKDEVFATVGEFANILAGNACSSLNRKNKLFGLRVAPPTIFYGESINVSKVDLQVISCVTATLDIGEVRLNIGFKRGEGEWTLSI